MNKYAEKQENISLQELADVLYEDDEIEYIALEHQTANKEKITVGNSTSIFTKLKKYSYEFEINSSLQLASINGIKLATEDTVILNKEEYNNMINRLEFLENNKGKIKRVNLGYVHSLKTTTFNVTAYSGYENFTVENFGCSIITNMYGTQYNTSTSYGSISYNPETGIVTYPYAGRAIHNGLTVSYEAYLYYIDYTK